MGRSYSFCNPVALSLFSFLYSLILKIPVIAHISVTSKEVVRERLDG
jgi:hypothetical protein